MTSTLTIVIMMFLRLLVPAATLLLIGTVMERKKAV
jgi:hypothetical protein